MATSSSARTLPARLLAGLLGLGTVTACAYDLEFAGRLTGLGLLLATVLSASWRLSAGLMRRAHPCEALLATGITATTVVVLTVLLLGMAGCLYFRTALIAHLITWLVVSRWCQPKSALRLRLCHRLLHPGEPRAVHWAKLACLAAVLAAGALGIFDPRANYDAIGYHLTTAATWLQESTVRLVPTPFGDNAQAYLPADFELFETWLMLPLHSDLFARTAQCPFLGLMMLAAYVAARNLTAKRRYAVWAPLALLLCRHLLVQSGSAMVDVAVSSFVLSGLALAAAFGRTGQRYALLGAGLALGLAVGSKSPVLTLLPVLVPLAAVWAWPAVNKHPATSACLFLVALILPAAYWYGRNASLTGNPLYPLRVTLAGKVLLSGVYDGQVMRDWLFNRSHHPDAVAAVLDVLRPLAGQPVAGPRWLAFIALPLAWLLGLLGSVALGRPNSARLVRLLCLYLAVPVVLAVQWFVVPYQEPRFFFVPLGLFCVGLAVAADINRPLRLLTGLALVAHLLVCARWYAMLAVPLAAGLLALLGLPLLRRVAAARTSWALAGLALWWLLAVPASPEHTRPRAFARHPRFRDAWTWADRSIDRARIGYAGHNIPYFLFGPRLQNRVMPVNVDLHVDFAFHDYAALDNEMTRAEVLTPEVAYYRATLDHRAWLANMGRLQLDYLVISTVGENQMLSIRHDHDGFPVEARWAARSPKTLVPVYQDRQIRIYRLARPGPTPGQECLRPITRSEPDCFALRFRDPQTYAELYPWAEARLAGTPRLKPLLERLERRYAGRHAGPAGRDPPTGDSR